MLCTPIAGANPILGFHDSNFARQSRLSPETREFWGDLAEHFEFKDVPALDANGELIASSIFKVPRDTGYEPGSDGGTNGSSDSEDDDEDVMDYLDDEEQVDLQTAQARAFAECGHVWEHKLFSFYRDDT
jgi:hypothetical protein